MTTARDKTNELASKLIEELSKSFYSREEMRRILTAAVRRLGKLGIKPRGSVAPAANENEA